MSAWESRLGNEAMEAIIRIANELKRMNDLKERELEVLTQKMSNKEGDQTNV